jgi:hypothetical protein
VHPDLENLAMIGEINGLYFTGFELQANWVMKLFKGEKKLPDRDITEAEMERNQARRTSSSDNQFPHGIYNHLIDELAAESGLLPNFERIKKEDKDLYRKLWHNGTIPSHFCFNTKPDLCLRVLDEVDEIMQKRYKFSMEEKRNTSTSLLAKKFSENFKLPMHLFKD